MAGKGHRPRPLSISRKEFDKRMDKIFGHKQPKKPERMDYIPEDHKFNCGNCSATRKS